MTEDQARNLVLVGTFGAAGVTALGQVTRTKALPSSRLLVGAAAAALILSLVLEVSPDLAAGLAALMLVTALFVLGGPAWSGIAAITSPPQPTATTGAPAAPNWN